MTKQADLSTVEARYQDLLHKLGVTGHDGAVAEIQQLRTAQAQPVAPIKSQQPNQCQRSADCAKPARHMGACKGMKRELPVTEETGAVAMVATSIKAEPTTATPEAITRNPSKVMRGRITIIFEEAQAGGFRQETSYPAALSMSSLHSYFEQFEYAQGE